MTKNFIGFRRISNKKALEKLTKQKSLSTLLKELQDTFNLFIRLRDTIYDKGQAYFICISCQQPKGLENMHAGHFFSVGGHPATRFDEDNTWGQCDHCNFFQHGNLVPYKTNLIKKIGPERFRILELRAHNRSKLMAFEVNLLIDLYKQNIEKLRKTRL